MREMRTAIDKLFILVGPEIASRLDFEVDSLDVLEAWLLRTFSDYREMLLDENVAAYDGAARYYGEVIRRTIGGEWVARFDDKRSYDYGYPVIDNYPGRTIPFDPHFTITAAIDRRLGNYLSSIVKRAQQRKGRVIV
jgi:hypothetical protein